MTDLHSGSIDFAHKQTIFGLVLMTRCAIQASFPGDWMWGRWRKANFADFKIYLKEAHHD